MARYEDFEHTAEFVGAVYQEVEKLIEIKDVSWHSNKYGSHVSIQISEALPGMDKIYANLRAKFGEKFFVMVGHTVQYDRSKIVWGVSKMKKNNEWVADPWLHYPSKNQLTVLVRYYKNQG